MQLKIYQENVIRMTGGSYISSIIRNFLTFRKSSYKIQRFLIFEYFIVEVRLCLKMMMLLLND